MKSRMSRFHPEAHVCRAIALLGVIIAPGCHNANRPGSDPKHPAELVGEWVDSAKTTSADTALWVLEANGEDVSAHQQLVAATGRYAGTNRRHYGYWFVRGDMRITSERVLCFIERPGRSKAECSSFDLDTLRMDGVARRRLRVHGYARAHRVANPVLLARTP
jgi:hypothetical protein